LNARYIQHTGHFRIPLSSLRSPAKSMFYRYEEPPSDPLPHKDAVTAEHDVGGLSVKCAFDTCRVDGSLSVRTSLPVPMLLTGCTEVLSVAWYLLAGVVSHPREPLADSRLGAVVARNRRRFHRRSASLVSTYRCVPFI
jgi:hypothetical protein